jgi:uncharacterized protein with NRDE domain
VCLILLAWRVERDFPLVVAANRDEFHAREAEPARFWRDDPRILAGRDLQAGGTWMGVSRGGRFAAVTNYRGGREPAALESRGALVARFLAGDAPPEKYVRAASARRADYSGFNLLVSDGAELWWLSNRDGDPRRLAPGIYGLGNFLLDTPEVEPAKVQFERALRPGPSLEPLFGVLEAARIVAADYGTRCATVLVCGADRSARFAERAFAPSGEALDTARFDFRFDLPAESARRALSR